MGLAEAAWDDIMKAAHKAEYERFRYEAWMNRPKPITPLWFWAV